MTDFLLANNTPDTNITFVTGLTLAFVWIFHMVNNLLDAFGTPLTLEMPTLLRDFAQQAVQTDAFDCFQSGLIFNNLSQNDMSPDTIEAMKDNLEGIHLLILHGVTQEIVLFIINKDLTITEFARITVGPYISVEHMFQINQQFLEALYRIIEIKGIVQLKLTILTLPLANMFTTSAPFIPLLDYMASNPWALFAYVYNNNDTWFFLNDIFNNLNSLLSFIQYLGIKCEQLFDMSINHPDGDLAEGSWFNIKATNQLLRYLEAIHNMYSPLDPVNTPVSRIMEEI